MESVSVGSCCTCDKQLVVVRWKDGKRIIVVACHDCRQEMHFDVERMLAMLEPPSDVLLSPGPTLPC